MLHDAEILPQLLITPKDVGTREWAVGEVLIWDNQRVLHRRDGFPDPMRRLMKRCQVLARENAG